MQTRTRQLHPLSPAPLPFAQHLHARTFLVPREHDSVLVYNTPTLAGDAEEIASLGGAAYQYLGHWHEAMFGNDEVRDELGLHLVVNEADRAATIEQGRTVDATFGERGPLDGHFEIIPTPGHTPGATAYLWDSGERRYLFSGDTIYLADGEWVAAMLESSDRDSYLESLVLLREIEFDVLVPWVASAGQPWFAETNRADARRRIDAVIERLRDGGDR
jgi:glyoxylase-like metal-dependent hydrolase (beta-lactamase superfamily II)